MQPPLNLESKLAPELLSPELLEQGIDVLADRIRQPDDALVDELQDSGPCTSTQLLW